MEGDPDGIGHYGYSIRRYDREDSKKAVEGTRFPDGDGLLKQPLIDQRFVGVDMALAVGQEKRMKKEADFNYGQHKLSIHTTDDQLRPVAVEEAQKQNRSEDEVFNEMKQRRNVVYNLTASVQTDRW